MITPIHRIAFKFSKHLFWKGLFIVLIFCSIQAKSQVPTKKNKCGTYEALEQFRLSNPKAETDQQFEDWIKLKIEEKKNSRTTTQSLIKIPIIFHIVHNGKGISDETNPLKVRIDSQIVQLNRDFANASGSTYQVAADIEVQFCAALLDKNGNILSEAGIDRIDCNTRGWNTPPYTDGYIDDIIMKQTHLDWSPYKYFNVWILDFADPDSHGRATIPLSYSTFLNNLFNQDRDDHSGVIISHKTVGSQHYPGVLGIFKGQGRVLTHETGHFLSLKHIWGDGLLGLCRTDNCDDTPSQADATNGCPSPGDPKFTRNCLFTNGKRMFENYMDYTEDFCMNTFTIDQKARMQAVLENSPRRKSLASSNVCCPSPDLVIISPDIEYSSVIAGDNVSVYFAEQNDGFQSASPNTIQFYLSEDDILTPGSNGDVLIGQYQVTNPVAALSQTILLNQQVAIPSTTASGTYSLFMVADGTNAINECIEDNNFASVSVQVSQLSFPSQASYKYWFDKSSSAAISTNLSTGNSISINQTVPTSTLSIGLHSFNIQFKDNSNKWSSVISSLFYKLGSYPLGSAKYEYWMDNFYDYKIQKAISNTNILLVNQDLELDDIDPGLHIFNIRFKPNAQHWSSITSVFFYKADSALPVGGSQYEYWIDNDFSNKKAQSIAPAFTIIQLDSLDMTNLPTGLHVFNIRFKKQNGHWSSTTSSFFYKGSISDGKLNKYQVWFDGVVQDTITTLTPNVADLTIDERLNTTTLLGGQHTYAIRFLNTQGISSSIITGQFYKGDPNDRNICPGSSTTLYAGSSGSSYQWQVDIGSGFGNVVNGAVYSGSTTDTLKLTIPPTSSYGYKYRCIINGQPGPTYTLKFSTLWLGNTNTAWNNTLNWGCGNIPDENTDVVINAGVSYYPVVNGNAVCKKLIINSTADLKVINGSTLDVKGK